jgi:hypothetical protein
MDDQKTKFAGSMEQRKKILIGFVVVAAVLSCALAWRDIARRSDGEVRGPKMIWRLIISVNPGNSLLYWLFGRK